MRLEPVRGSSLYIVNRLPVYIIEHSKRQIHDRSPDPRYKDKLPRRECTYVEFRMDSASSLSLYRPNLYFVEPLPLALSFPLFRLTFADSLRRESVSKG